MLTGRDKELIEVALESAISACVPLGSGDGDVADLAQEYRTARKHIRAEPKRSLPLTEREADELQTLLAMVLTNADQWDSMDLRALRRVHNKLVG